MELEFISLSCSQFIIKTRGSRVQGANPGSGGFHVEQAKYRDSVKLGEEKKMTCLLHLVPRAKLVRRNPSPFKKQPSFCECEPSRRHERCSKEASLCLTHVFPIDIWRQPSS